MSDAAPPAHAQTLDDFETRFDHAPFGYLILDPAGVVVAANLIVGQWIGVAPQALIGRRFRDLLTTPARIFYETNFAPMLRLEGRFDEVGLDVVAAGGEKLPMLVNAAERRDAAGQLAAIHVGLMRSRARREYERDLQGREAAAVRRLADERETSELREQFIAVLGHDLRNPLASIVGGARLLRREIQSEKGVKVLQLMEASVDRMAGLIDDVLDFARGRLGSGIALQRETGALVPVLNQVVDELETSQPSRVFIRRFDVSEPVSFDPGRLAQLVSNLVGNALTHGDAKAPIEIGAEVEDGLARIWVANCGPPIPPKAMERLFMPFFRGEVRPSQQGLGLGLHIASQIARAHDGALTVQSDPVETRFILSMPATPAQDGR